MLKASVKECSVSCGCASRSTATLAEGQRGWDDQRPPAPLTPSPGGSVHRRVSHDDPIPAEVVRDLLALARALYAAFAKMGPAYDGQLFKLRGIGFQLNLALEKAAKGKAGTFANRSAWLIAEKATADLGALVDAYLPARALITATGERLAKKAQ